MRVHGALMWMMFAATTSAFAAELAPHGFVDTYRAGRFEDGQYIGSRTRFRVEADVAGEAASAFVSVDAVRNDVQQDDTGVRLREAYVDYAAEGWDLRVGRQIIVWGKADGLAITDVLCPPDYSEFLARDYDDIRIPVDAVRWRSFGAASTFEVVIVPRFVPAVTPPVDSPWAIHAGVPSGVDDVVVTPPLMPENTVANGEAAVRLSFNTARADVALSVFRTWSDFPSLRRSLDTSGPGTVLNLYPEYHRLTVAGAEFSLPAGAFVWRGEAAASLGVSLEAADPLSERQYRKNVLKVMFGTDWSPGHDWQITAQIVDTAVLDYDPALQTDENSWLATLRVSKKLLPEQSLEVSAMAYLGLSHDEGFVRASADYAAADGMHLVAGVDVFYGEAAGELGRYDDNDQLWVKAKYSF